MFRSNAVTVEFTSDGKATPDRVLRRSARQGGRRRCHVRVRALARAIRRAIGAMKQHGVLFEPTLFVFRAPDGAADTSLARRREMRAAEFTRAAHEAGVRILAGTDGMGGDGDGDVPNIHEEMALLVEKAGLTPMEALVATTATGAQVLGQAGTHGTIVVGKTADPVLLSADPTADIGNTKKIVDVIPRGRCARRQERSRQLATANVRRFLALGDQ